MDFVLFTARHFLKSILRENDMGLTTEIGNAGETFVAEFLRKKGFIISARNYRSRFGEVDVIAENNELILFVEIKTRSENTKISPKEFVDKNKQRKIISTAGIYLQCNTAGLQPRFDVAEVFVSSDGKMRLNYIENAFGTDGFEFF